MRAAQTMKITHADLKTRKDPPDACVWLALGPEDYARRAVVSWLCTRYLDSSFADFDCDRIEGGSLRATHALGAWQTFPMSSERRVVVVRRVDDAPSAELEKLAHGVSAACPRGCLVLEASSDTPAGMKGLAKAVEAAGVVVSCAAARQEDARVFLRGTAEEAGVSLDQAAAEELLRRAGPDLWQLASEVRKLANYVFPNTTVRRPDVDAMVAEAPEDRIFAMIDAVCDGRAGVAGQMLDDLFRVAGDDRSAAHRTLAVLVRHFRLLWQARVLRDAGFQFRDSSGIPPSAMGKMLTNPSLPDSLKRTPFLLRKYGSQTQKYTMDALTRAMAVLAETDLALKGQGPSVGDPRGDLKMCLARLGALAQSAGRPGTR